MQDGYYPKNIDNRAEWWENILAKADGILTPLGFSADRVTSIKNDAAWGVYCYRTLRVTYEGFLPVVIAYANTILDGRGALGTDLPEAPIVPAWPAAPAAVIDLDIEARREAWVQEIKKAPGYSTSIGEDLRLIAPEHVFDFSAYVAELRDVFCSAPRTVSGKFRKARGNADGVVIRARKAGTIQWTDLGRYTASPFSVAIPLAGYEPEAWEVQAQAFRRDVPFGQPSPIFEVLVKG